MSPDEALRSARVCTDAARVFEQTRRAELAELAGSLRFVAALLLDLFEPADLMREPCALAGCSVLVDAPRRYCSAAHKQAAYRRRVTARDVSTHAGGGCFTLNVEARMGR